MPPPLPSSPGCDAASRCAGRPPSLRFGATSRMGRSATTATNRFKGPAPGAAWGGRQKLVLMLVVLRLTRQF